MNLSSFLPPCLRAADPMRVRAATGSLRRPQTGPVGLLAAGWLIVAGCGRTPPPPPPVAEVAPVEVEPERADPREVARNLGPFYFVLFDRGFSVDVVDTPSRARVRWPANQWEFDALRSSYSALNPKMAVRIADAWTATPRLGAIATEMGISDPAQSAAVAAWARLVAPERGSSSGPPRLAPSLARDTLLAIGLRQALQDADQKNFHRSHVLLTDMAEIMNESSPLQQREGRDIFIKFFREVPDTARFEDFSARLSAYSEARRREVLLAGEHAAVLHAAGLTSAAAFMRDQLLSQFDLITLPMIDRAIRRGVSFGFPAPEQVTRLRAQLESLAAALREGAADPAVPYLREAVAEPGDAAYRGQLEAFEKMWANDAAAAGEQATAEQRLEELAAVKRPVGDWFREKVAVVKNAPLLTLRPPMTERFFEMISPLGYDPTAKRLLVERVSELPARADGVGEALVGWCRGGTLPDELANGSGHAILAWYWLESGRP